MRKNVSRFYREIEGQEFFIEIALTTPESANDESETYQTRRESERVVTLQSTLRGDDLQYLAETDNPAFSVKIFTYGTSDFTNNTLKLANGVTREHKTQAVVYVDTQDSKLAVSKIVSDTNVLESFVHEAIAYMIDKHITKASKNEQNRQWSTKDGRKAKI